MSLEVKNLVKIFDGRKILNNISLKVENGHKINDILVQNAQRCTILFFVKIKIFSKIYSEKRLMVFDILIRCFWLRL